MKSTTLVLAALVGFAATLPSLAADFHWQGRLAAGKTVEIKGVNGDIEAEPASGNEVEVVAVKKARRDDPDSVEIKLVEHEGGVTICAVYPSSGRGRNECAPGSGGHMDSRNNDVDVHFSVRVPAGVRFAGHSVNGSIDAQGLDADVDVSTVNGSIEATSRGVVRGETVNGSIRASLGDADWTGPLAFSTVNGSITIELPGDASADVRASVVNGDIETDFPLTVKGKWGPRSMKGTIGAGGRELQLETVNGGIKLRKRG
jgi:DUF4097 and DUF4098 domain-containing protein YvlB